MTTMDSSTVSEFPRYVDGDVLIIVTPRQRYQLHANVLRRCSTYFERLLTPENAAQLNSRAKKDGVSILYQLELTKKPMGGHGGVGAFRLKELDAYGRASATFSFDFLENENGKAPNEEYKFWDFLLGIFYNRAPKVKDTNLVHTLGDCMGIIDVAESIGAVNSIREHVDLALLRYGSVLYNSIATSPSAWADLGFRVHSPSIFREAIIHLVGKWNMLSSEEKGELRTQVRDLCQQKFNELDIAKEAIEMRILGHYPEMMTRTAADKPGRPAYCNDIYMWMSLCFFRQWFAQCINDNRTRRAVDGGYTFYHSIHKAGRAYLIHEDFRNFHQYFPMSGKACNILETNMGMLKDEVKFFVADLTANRTSVDPASYDLKWLTCTVVEKEDCPWETATPSTAGEEVVANQFDPASGTRRHSNNRSISSARNLEAGRSASSPPNPDTSMVVDG